MERTAEWTDSEKMTNHMICHKKISSSKVGAKIDTD